MPGPLGGKKRVLDRLEPELQMAINHRGILGIEPESSGKAASGYSLSHFSSHLLCSFDHYRFCAVNVSL